MQETHELVCSAEGIGAATGRLTHGVYLLGVHTPEKDNLMTAAWLCQVSAKPATIAVAVASAHLTAELIAEAGSFAVSVLTSAQKELATRNGTVSGRVADKLAQTSVHFGALGHPIADGAAAALECRVTQTLEVRDHVVFFAEVVSGASTSDEVLRFQSGTMLP